MTIFFKCLLFISAPDAPDRIKQMGQGAPGRLAAGF